MQQQKRVQIVVVRGADPVRLRAVIEAEGWQMPLAFLAGGDELALVEVMARRARRRDEGLSAED